MINEAWLAPGSWSLRLKETTPRAVRDALDWTKTPAAAFGHVFVFPARTDAESLSSADRLAASIWTGVLLEWSDAYTVGGAGPGWWLGDSSGKGPLIETAISNTSGSLATWLTSLTPSSLTAGTATGGTTVTASFQWVTYRQAIEAILAANSASATIGWWVTPEMKLYFGASPTTSTPTALALRRSQGHEAFYSAIGVTDLNRSMDMREYVSKVRVNGPSAVGTYSAASPYKDINGNAVSIIEFIDVPTAAPGTENTVAQTEYVARNAIRRQVTIASDDYAIAAVGLNGERDIETGGYIYVFDPDLGLMDKDVQVQFQGQTVFPLQMRVMAQSWPVRTGMGVWFRDGDGTLTDLTDWFEPETQNASIEVGAIPRTLANPSGIQGLQDIGQVGPAVDNAAWVSYTPQIDQGVSTNIAKTINYARYRRDGSRLVVEFDLSVTAAGTSGSAITVTLPVDFATTAGGAKGIGQIYDASAVNRYVCCVERAGTSKVGFAADGAYNGQVGATPSFALANGDVVRASIDCEIAV